MNFIFCCSIELHLLVFGWCLLIHVCQRHWSLVFFLCIMLLSALGIKIMGAHDMSFELTFKLFGKDQNLSFYLNSKIHGRIIYFRTLGNFLTTVLIFILDSSSFLFHLVSLLVNYILVYLEIDTVIICWQLVVLSNLFLYILCFYNIWLFYIYEIFDSLIWVSFVSLSHINLAKGLSVCVLPKAALIYS